MVLINEVLVLAFTKKNKQTTTTTVYLQYSSDFIIDHSFEVRTAVFKVVFDRTNLIIKSLNEDTNHYHLGSKSAMYVCM